MEDTHFIARRSVKEDMCTLVGLFDGHYGEAASTFCQANFPEKFFEILEKKGDDVTSTMRETFETIEQTFLEEAIRQQTEAGTTATVAVILGTKLVLGNVGDSEAVLY